MQQKRGYKFGKFTVIKDLNTSAIQGNMQTLKGWQTKTEVFIMLKWLVIMVESGSDGDAENGPCEPLWFKDIVSASCSAEAERIANKKWNEPDERFPDMIFPENVCSSVSLATAADIAEYEKMISECQDIPFN